MFEKAMTKSIESYLQPGEELLNATIVQGKGLAKMTLAGGVVGAMAVAAARDRKSRQAAAGAPEGEVQLSSKMGIGVTTRRLLLFKAGGAMTLTAKELLTDVPIAEVDSIEAGKAVMTKPVTITIRGQAFHVEAPRAANTDKLVAAFAQAKSEHAAAAA
jgi:hypothetical protein